MVIVTRVQIQDGGDAYTMAGEKYHIFFGQGIDDELAIAGAVDASTFQLVNWIRVAEKQMGRRYYDIVLKQLNELYFDASEDVEYKGM